MPIHDWTRVDAGTFYAFHTTWIAHLAGALNNGLLPDEYYAMPEQHAGRSIADVLTLHVGEEKMPPAPTSGAVAVAEAPPKVSKKLSLSPAIRGSKRTLTIRHVSGHRIIALVEIISPANKDRPSHVNAFVEKAIAALNAGCHLLCIDLFSTTLHDPKGINGAICEAMDGDEYTVPENKPLAAASFAAADPPDAYVEFFAFGDRLIDMPIFLDPDFYVPAPLEETYGKSFHDMPAIWRNVLDAD